MKKFMFAFIALSLVTLGLTACRKNRINFVQTSYLVNYSGVHKGDLLVFQVPSGSKDKQDTKYYVHFVPGTTPCKDPTIPAVDGKLPQCEVIVEPADATRYFFSINNSPDAAPIHKGCPPWFCSGAVVVGGSSPGPVDDPLVHVSGKSDSTAAAELLIYYDDDDKPAADSLPLVQGQPVTWVTNGVDKYGYTVTFNDPICKEGPTITAQPGEKKYCTLTLDPQSVGTHLYSLTVGDKTGTGLQLTVKKAPTSSKAQ